MADIRPDRLTTCQSERKSIVCRRPSVACPTRLYFVIYIHNIKENRGQHGTAKFGVLIFVFITVILYCLDTDKLNGVYYKLCLTRGSVSQVRMSYRNNLGCEKYYCCDILCIYKLF
jgi:hypothetical protein